MFGWAGRPTVDNRTNKSRNRKPGDREDVSEGHVSFRVNPAIRSGPVERAVGCLNNSRDRGGSVGSVEGQLMNNVAGFADRQHLTVV